MIEHRKADSISIQVFLSGFSFTLRQKGRLIYSSPCLGADKVFATTDLQTSYESLDLSLFTPKCTLVPKSFFEEDKARDLLSKLFYIGERDLVSFVELAAFDAILLYTSSALEPLSRLIVQSLAHYCDTSPKIFPELYYSLQSLHGLPKDAGGNKIVLSLRDSYLHLIVANEEKLLFANVYETADFVTALYYTFSVLKKLNIRPDLSTISFRNPLSKEQEMALYRYFHTVEYVF